MFPRTYITRDACFPSVIHVSSTQVSLGMGSVAVQYIYSYIGSTCTCLDYVPNRKPKLDDHFRDCDYDCSEAESMQRWFDFIIIALIKGRLV